MDIYTVYIYFNSSQSYNIQWVAAIYLGDTPKYSEIEVYDFGELLSKTDYYFKIDTDSNAPISLKFNNPFFGYLKLDLM